MPAKEEFVNLLNQYGGEGEKAYKAMMKNGNSNLNVQAVGSILTDFIVDDLLLIFGLLLSTINIIV